MIWLAIGFILLGIFLGASGMKRAGRTLRNVAKSAWRPGVSMLALVALVGSIVALMRQAWVPGLILAAVFVFFSLSARKRPSLGAAPPPSPPKGGMTLQDAALTLGVAPDATTEEIQAAYVRLMRVVHPDHGGATGLAMQLNAARDLMLEARRRG
jgi:hypothetical protein